MYIGIKFGATRLANFRRILICDRNWSLMDCFSPFSGRSSSRSVSLIRIKVRCHFWSRIFTSSFLVWIPNPWHFKEWIELDNYHFLSTMIEKRPQPVRNLAGNPIFLQRNQRDCDGGKPAGEKIAAFRTLLTCLPVQPIVCLMSLASRFSSNHILNPTYRGLKFLCVYISR